MSPIFAGCVAAVYVGSGASRFDPAHNAMVYVVDGEPQSPLDREDLRAYQHQLKHFLAGAYPEEGERKVEKNWAKLQSHATAGVDEDGHPILRMQVGEQVLDIGVSANNLFASDAPPQFVRQLMEARLASELSRSPHGITDVELARDWQLLQKASIAPDSRLTAHAGPHSPETARGNGP